MRTLSSTLLAAQKQANRIPCVKVVASNGHNGVVRLNWERLYTGSETDCYHAMTMPGDGSLIRVRLSPLGEGGYLYRQRITTPDQFSDFSQWNNTGQYGAAAVACASLEAEVSIFWTLYDRRIFHAVSTDYGASWGSPQLVDYTPSMPGGLAVAYQTNGDIALFFTDQSVLYLIQRIDGEWQSRVGWGKYTGDLTSVAAVYDGDWNLLVTGKDIAGNLKVWSVVYGGGGEWTSLQTISSAPADSDFDFNHVFLDKPDVFRFFLVESYTGEESYNRPYGSLSIPGCPFGDNLWREPEAFNVSSGYGLAMSHHGDYCWLSSPGGVWRAKLAVGSIDLSEDVLSAKEELSKERGSLTVELRNDSGQYSSLGGGDLAVLDTGCQIDFSPGYRTSEGEEFSEGQSFALDSYEHISSSGKAIVLLNAYDGWESLRRWTACHQFRWNRDSEEASVRQIMALVLARAGLKLDVISQSETVSNFYPDFTIHPGDSGSTVIARLLSLVPDVLFMEGAAAYMVNPLPMDSPVYTYGVEHAILEGRYKKGIPEFNRVQVEGYDSAEERQIITNSFSWEDVQGEKGGFLSVEDKNLKTIEMALGRGEILLRKAEVGSVRGILRIPVNCGQQVFDVITITDGRAGLNEVKRRVVGISLSFAPHRGEYEQRLGVGGV